jgi:hypothetical protein
MSLPLEKERKKEKRVRQSNRTQSHKIKESLRKAVKKKEKENTCLLSTASRCRLSSFHVFPHGGRPTSRRHSDVAVVVFFLSASVF